jgi:hypothetical protein
MVLITPSIRPSSSDPSAGVLHVSFPPEDSLPPFEVPLTPSAATLAAWDTIDDATHIAWQNVDAHLVPASLTPSLSAFLGRPVRLAYNGAEPHARHETVRHAALEGDIRFQDKQPVLLASAESAAEVGRRVARMVGTQGVGEKWRGGELPIDR